jgi:hypothetical protein
MTFSALLTLHRELDELFFTHQRALMRMNLDQAGAALEEFEAALLAHIQDEEELMIPIYLERAEPPVGATAEIFLGEHHKICQYLELFKAEMLKLGTAEDLERGVLFLIDSQHIFKRLLVHHDTRERKFLYPILDEVTSESERLELFASLKLALPMKATVS